MNEESTTVLPGPHTDRNLERALRLGAYTDKALDDKPELVVEGAMVAPSSRREA